MTTASPGTGLLTPIPWLLRNITPPHRVISARRASQRERNSTPSYSPTSSSIWRLYWEWNHLPPPLPEWHGITPWFGICRRGHAGLRLHSVDQITHRSPPTHADRSRA